MVLAMLCGNHTERQGGTIERAQTRTTRVRPCGLQASRCNISAAVFYTRFHSEFLKHAVIDHLEQPKRELELHTLLECAEPDSKPPNIPCLLMSSHRGSSNSTDGLIASRRTPSLVMCATGVGAKGHNGVPQGRRKDHLDDHLLAEPLVTQEIKLRGL
ncbi:hypothetical protein EJB05_35637, partial [Eragrostis curvula]